MTQGLNYDQKIDVYSYGIVAHVILFETITPYGPNLPMGIDYLISKDPNYRPELPKDLNSYLSVECNFSSKPKVHFFLFANPFFTIKFFFFFFFYRLGKTRYMNL